MERLYTPAQVSEMLGMSVKTLEKWRWERRNLPYVKLGAAVRYKESDLEAWLDEHATALQAVSCAKQCGLRIAIPSQHGGLEQVVLQLVALQPIEGERFAVQPGLHFLVQVNLEAASEETFNWIAQKALQ